MPLWHKDHLELKAIDKEQIESLFNQASQVALVVKNPPANEGDLGLIPGLGRYPGGGHGNPLQYSCLENPMDRGAWQATVHVVTKNQTQPSMHNFNSYA